MNRISTIIKETFRHYRNKNASRMGSSLAYYAVFAFVPLLLLITNISIIFFNRNVIESGLVQSFSNIGGMYLSSYFDSLINNIPEGFGTISIIINIMVAVGIFSVLRKDLNELWNTSDKIQTDSIVEKTKHILFDKVVSFSIVPLIALLMILSIGIGIFYTNLNQYFDMPNLFRFLSFTVSIFISTFFFSIVYRIFPKITLPWKNIWFGAFVTTILILIGNLLIGFYIYRISGFSIFNAIGSFAVFLAWVYYCAQAFFLGASFTYVYSNRSISRGEVRY